MVIIIIIIIVIISIVVNKIFSLLLLLLLLLLLFRNFNPFIGWQSATLDFKDSSEDYRWSQQDCSLKWNQLYPSLVSPEMARTIWIFRKGLSDFREK